MDREAIETLGMYYGYPECCIASFVERFEEFLEGRKLSALASDSTGYVPCEVCKQKSEEERRTEISWRRFCPTPFPHGTIG